MKAGQVDPGLGHQGGEAGDEVERYFAVALADVLLARFQDPEAGGFYFTSDDHERLIHRPKPLADESVPSGNGVAAQALQRLGHLFGDVRYLDAARGTLSYAGEQIARSPHAHASLLSALDEYLQPPETIVIRGPADGLRDWQRRAQKDYAPRRLVVAIPAGEERLPGTLAAAQAGDGLYAYRCRGTSCDLPARSLEELSSRATG